jgi:nicotinamide riboside transporter PnuC
MFETISQVAILILSAAAIWFVSRREHWKRWGYIIGLCSQPFWFYTTITNKQYGMVLLSLWYTYSWAQGVLNYWVKGEHID